METNIQPNITPNWRGNWWPDQGGAGGSGGLPSEHEYVNENGIGYQNENARDYINDNAS